MELLDLLENQDGLIPLDHPRLGEVNLNKLLGIKKWEQPLPAELAGQAEGLFPSFIRRTDQERCQNIVNEIFQYEDRITEVEDFADLPEEAFAKGHFRRIDGKVFKVMPAIADPNALYETTMKMDGSSCTVFARNVQAENGLVVESGVCSRNLQLKVNEANAENTFIRVATQSSLVRLLEKLAAEGIELAVQGELMGPGIQGNRENLKEHKLFIFDVQNITEQRYLTTTERYELLGRFVREGLDLNLVTHTPVLVGRDNKFSTRPDANGTIVFRLQDLGITNVKELLAFAEGPSLVHKDREGLVFKRFDGKFSFKAISNKFLAGEK